MKESDPPVTLAQEFWDTDQVLFVRGLLPRNWFRIQWGLVVNLVPADRRAQWGHRCHQSQVTPGRCGPVSYHAKQDRLPPHAC